MSQTKNTVKGSSNKAAASKMTALKVKVVSWATGKGLNFSSTLPKEPVRYIIRVIGNLLELAGIGKQRDGLVHIARVLAKDANKKLPAEFNQAVEALNPTEFEVIIRKVENDPELLAKLKALF